ncbi:MAG: FHA domain-containing protein [Anaerolineae bacterium]|nr:MAG: FHA domain-containing protein [Anaerolineae bacterium]
MSATALLILRILLALSLYMLLGWALWLLWRDIRQQGALLAGRKAPSITLTVQRPGAPPQSFRFEQVEITLGRDPNCEVPLDDGTVSARHARLAYHHGQWWLEDLGSTNGTLLNGELLTTPTVVISGDEIRCGQTTLTLALTAHTLIADTLRIQSGE